MDNSNDGEDDQLQQQQQHQQQQQQQQKPRDGPATVFEADPLVSDIFTCEDGDYFGLVLVTNWPPSPLDDMVGPYQDFLRAVRTCFKSEDITASKTTTTTTPIAAVYLYPTMHLHITLATFFPPTKINNNNSGTSTSNEEEDERLITKEQAINLVRFASKLPDWPTRPLRLVVDSTQLGKRAGILLWKDLSGGVAAIRNCLRQVADSIHENSTSLEKDNNSTTFPMIPGIIHSTFLRFSRIPETPGYEVQERFQSEAVSRIGDFFLKETPIVADTVKLVCESTPYMHIPDDDKHVLWNSELSASS